MRSRNGPSAKLDDLLMGRTAWEDADPAIRSWAAFFIFDAAKTILKAPKEKRRGMLGKIPALIRPRVEDEIRRLFKASP